MNINSKIYIAGHRGLIGSALIRRLNAHHYTHQIIADRSQLELTNSAAVNHFFDVHKPEYVVLAAGRVGGIVENQRAPADFIYTNLAIQLNVLQAAQRNGVCKLILLASSCMYPRECPQPMVEEMLLSGKPELTSMAYAISKLAGMQMCLAYNQQFGRQRYIPVIPNSVYGPNDNFDPQSGHVLSALIHRFHQAKLAGATEVTLWGSGTVRREFIHADDVADACIYLLANDSSRLPLPVNVGSGNDYPIHQLAEIIAYIVGYRGTIAWDRSKPDGAPQKLLNSNRIRTFGWKPSVDFIQSLRGIYRWYLENSWQKEKRCEF